MTDKKISALTAATTPLTGTEVLPIVQAGATVKVAVSDLTAGRAITATSINKMVVTTPATSSTLTIADGKTLTSSNSLTLAGTDATTMTFPTTSATVARTDAANSFTGNQTLATGNLVIGTSGKGIDFSATPGTGTSELLADYEEGTWTPSLGGSATYSTQSGSYTKVGRLVFIRGILVITAIGTGSTTQISGLPFANASGAVCGISVGSFFASATSVNSFFASVANGGSVINVYSLVVAGTTEGTSAIFGNGTQFQFSGCYSV